MESGNVNAAVTVQPLISILEGVGKGRPLPNASGLRRLQFMVASNSALSDPATAAAIQDFLVRLARAQAIIGTHLQHTIDTFAATYGVSKAEASQAVRAADNGFTPISRVDHRLPAERGQRLRQARPAPAWTQGGQRVRPTSQPEDLPHTGALVVIHRSVSEGHGAPALLGQGIAAPQFRIDDVLDWSTHRQLTDGPEVVGSP